jgi:hypothetical protein
MDRLLMADLDFTPDSLKNQMPMRFVRFKSASVCETHPVLVFLSLNNSTGKFACETLIAMLSVRK